MECIDSDYVSNNFKYENTGGDGWEYNSPDKSMLINVLGSDFINKHSLEFSEFDAFTIPGNGGHFIQLKASSLSQDSIHNVKSMQIDSILTLIVPDSCAVTTAFFDIYSFVHDGMSLDSLSRDGGTQAMLHNVAIQCPSEYGHVVYTARAYMRSITNYDYESIRCDGDVDSREQKQSGQLMKESDIIIYPNPASDILIIDSGLLTEGSIEIYNITYQQMLDISIKYNITKINVDLLPAGVYLVRISDSKNTILSHEKIIIQ